MRNRFVQIGLSVALLLLLIQVVLIAPSQIRDAETKAALIPTPSLSQNDAVDQSLQGMHMIETHEGKKEWEIWADQAVSLKAKELLRLQAVKSIFFSESGVTFNTTGNKGTVQVKSKNLRIEGDVVMKSSNGYVFRTPDMDYYSDKRVIETDSPVEMIGPKDMKGRSLHLKGSGMFASLEKGSMEVLRDVRAELGLDQGRKAQIKSHRSLFNGKNRTAKFMGDVVLDMDSMRITGPEAQFLYDPKNDTLKTVVFSGGARVSDMDKWATAQRVSVDFETNRFVFRGNPRVVQNNDELRGEEIVFLDGGKRVQVSRARAKVDEKRLESKPQ
ncbi:MAG TPA: LPS export ABC transporter periplasmic protein LptC [Bdellovibrionales bacterium]|nr:LPS export ABC transporter periplasmic protein LptC [Bdellovibrionales bacterium]